MGRTYTLHVPVTSTYLIDVEADSPEEARAKGCQELALIGLPPRDELNMEEDIQFDIIVVSWAGDDGRFYHTNVGKPTFFTEGEAELSAELLHTYKRSDILFKKHELLIKHLCVAILEDNPNRKSWAKEILNELDQDDDE